MGTFCICLVLDRKAASNENSHCGAFRVTASGLLYECCSGSFRKDFSAENDARREEGEAAKEINIRLFRSDYFHTP